MLGLAITSATSTDQSSFITRFFASLFGRLTQWFADTTNGITDFFARRIHAKDELCVGDVCVTRDEFLRMKENQSAAADDPTLAADGTPSGSSTPLENNADTATSKSNADTAADAPPPGEAPADRPASAEADDMGESGTEGESASSAPPELEARTTTSHPKSGMP
jgi:hypothetical protein